MFTIIQSMYDDNITYNIFISQYTKEEKYIRTNSSYLCVHIYIQYSCTYIQLKVNISIFPDWGLPFNMKSTKTTITTSEKIRKADYIHNANNKQNID